MANRLLFFLLFATPFAQAQNIEFAKQNIQEVLDASAKSGKLIFVDAYANWCRPCKIMDANVFTNKDVADFFNENFHNLKVNVDFGEGKVFADKYRIQFLPTLLFLNAKGEVVHKTSGYQDKSQLINHAKEALQTK